MDELLIKMLADFSDECVSVTEYFDMSGTLKEADHHDMAKILCAMAVDEYTHARVIFEFLKEHNMQITDKGKSLWANAVAVMQKHGHLDGQ